MTSSSRESWNLIRCSKACAEIWLSQRKWKWWI